VGGYPIGRARMEAALARQRRCAELGQGWMRWMTRLLDGEGGGGGHVVNVWHGWGDWNWEKEYGLSGF
jgi:hypothetical protein